jgi:hypothetical protein
VPNRNRPGSLGNFNVILYTPVAMFSQRVILRKLLANTLSVCLLALLLGCVAVCAEHLEGSPQTDAHSLSQPCADDVCPVTATSMGTLPERLFFSCGCDNGVSQPVAGFHAEFTSGESARRLLFPSSPSPPLERLCVLRI